MPTQPMPRQQRRKLLRDRLERGRKALARGLPRPFGEDDAVGIALVLREVIDDPARPTRASDLAAMAEGLLERTLATDTRGLELACAKGCSHCCRLTVTCTAPEILRVAGWLRRQSSQPHAAGRIAAVETEAVRRRGLTSADLKRDKPPCPLLVSNACGVYEARPLPCRSLLSMSAAACELAITEGRGQVPLVTGALGVAEQIRAMMLAAMQPLGATNPDYDSGYDLTGGLAVALAQPDAEARWLAGDNPFKDVRTEQRPPKSRALQDRLVECMAELGA